MANDEFDALNALEKEAKEYDKVSGMGNGEQFESIDTYRMLK